MSELDAPLPNKANAIFFCPLFLSMVDRDREPLIWEAISLSHDGLFLSPLLSRAFQDKCIRRAIIFLSMSKYHTTHHAIYSINNRRDYRDTSPGKQGSHGNWLATALLSSGCYRSVALNFIASGAA